MALNLDKWLDTLFAGKWLTEREVRVLCDQAKDLLAEENNVQMVRAPVTICGDIHGQFYDLLELFKAGGDIPSTSYVFMGDMVDRGHHSVETLCLLVWLKLKYPAHVTILRGNHESRMVTRNYGFYDEVMAKYGNLNVWSYCTELFDFLSIAAVVEGKILCIHGGLSPDVKTIDQMRLIDRFQEIPYNGAFWDLMWSDPDNIETWGFNPRGAGLIFGSKVTNEFNRINGFDLICRAHQLVMEGYKFWFDNENLVTVWSAPNYCYRCGNAASILKVDDNLAYEFEMFYESSDSSKSLDKARIPYFL